jgi:hypothetical protein
MSTAGREKKNERDETRGFVLVHESEAENTEKMIDIK